MAATIPQERLRSLIRRHETVAAQLAAGQAGEDFVRLSREFAELDPVAVAALVTDDGRRRHLAETLDSIRWRLRALADEIALVHFAQPVPSRTLDDTWGVESEDDIAGADDSDDTDEEAGA